MLLLLIVTGALKLMMPEAMLVVSLNLMMHKRSECCYCSLSHEKNGSNCTYMLL